MSRTERLFDLLQLLRSYKFPVTAARLAERLEVTVRTVYRDITTLQVIGAPVEGEAGLGYILRPGFLLPPLMFASEEIEALVLGARWVAGRGDPALAEAARNALARIRAVLPLTLREELEDAPLLVGPSTRPGVDPALIAIRRAIRQQRKVHLRYRSVEGKASERVVWPFALSFFETTRLMAAWCELRKDYRVFRVDLVEQARVLPSVYPRRRAELLREWHQQRGIPRQDLSADP